MLINHGGGRGKTRRSRENDGFPLKDDDQADRMQIQRFK